MTLAAVCWASSHPAASPAERLTLICLGDRSDEFGLAIVDLESLADSAVCDAIALADLLVELQRRDVLRFMPHLNGLYEEMAGLVQSDHRLRRRRDHRCRALPFDCRGARRSRRHLRREGRVWLVALACGVVLFLFF